MAPSRSQDGPKMPQEGHKKQQKHENETCWAPRGATPVSESPLGTHLGVQVDPFWTNFGDFLSTCLRRGFFIDFWWFLGGLRTFIFWFSLRRKHNFDIFGKVLVGIVFDPQNLPKIVQKMVPRGVQEALKRLQQFIQKKVFHSTQTRDYDHARGLPDSPPRARIFE